MSDAVRHECIRCPRCQSLQDAAVTWTPGHPWPTFAHRCEACGYLIGESEWEVVKGSGADEDTDVEDTPIVVEGDGV